MQSSKCWRIVLKFQKIFIPELYNQSFEAIGTQKGVGPAQGRAELLDPELGKEALHILVEQDKELIQDMAEAVVLTGLPLLLNL